MDNPTAHALVDEYLHLASLSPSRLEGKGWTKEWYRLIQEQSNGDHGSPTEADLQAIVDHDVQRTTAARERRDKLDAAVLTDKNMQRQILEVADERLRELGIQPADLQRVPRGLPRLSLLSRLRAGQAQTIGTGLSMEPWHFVVEVAVNYIAPDRHYRTRTLCYPETTTRVEFHRQLQDLTTSWHARECCGCPQGFTPYNGTWVYDMGPQDSRSGKLRETKVALDGAVAFDEMKEALLRPRDDVPQFAYLLVHSKLQEHRARSTRLHRDLCDRTGGTGHAAISSSGHPFDETLDLERIIGAVESFD